MNLEGGVVATVVESKSDNFKVGDTVVGTSHGRKYFLAKRIKYKSRFKHSQLSYYLSILGMTGLTAYFGLMDICKGRRLS
jgi:NADPH-dependent curcumin reductase CurA